MADRRGEIADNIRQRIVSGLHLGTMRAGTRLPSTRETAEEFDVAPRTVMAAYRQLEAEGLVQLRERSGIYVADAHPSERGMLAQLAGWVVEVLVEARAREIAPITYPERVRRCLETLRLRAVCVAGNTDQLAQICYELHSDYGIHAQGLEPEDLTSDSDDARQALRRADLVVTTAVFAGQVHRVAEPLGRQVVTIVLRPELRREMERRLSQGPVYWVGTDPRFEQVLHAVHDPAGYGHNVRLVVLGRDDPDLIPEDAPTYVMRSAHEPLRGTPLGARVLPLPRVFSDETAREILTFVIRSNMAALAGPSA